MYSLNNQGFGDVNSFENLPAGDYQLIIQDDNGCELNETVQIEPSSNIDVDVLAYPTFCGENNGAIEINISSGSSIEVTINGQQYGTTSLIENLSAGQYDVNIEDVDGCKFDTLITVSEGAVNPTFINVDIIPDFCNEGSGEITVEVEGGTSPFTFRINDMEFQGLVANGLGAGEYIIEVTDALGCLSSIDVTVPLEGELILELIETTAPNCQGEGGSILVRDNGGNNISYSIDNVNFQDSPLFTNLESGEYIVFAQDDSNCSAQIDALIPCSSCDVYIPNTFDKSDSGINNVFQIFTSREFEMMVQTYLIYDRWGNLVYEKSNFSIHSEDDNIWWDGYKSGNNLESGVYTYVITTEDSCNGEKTYAGDVTVLE